MKKFIILFLLLTTKVNATEVYFTPSNDCQEQIIKLINKAQYKIDIAIYSFTDDKIYNEVIKKRKITTIVVDKQQSQNRKSKVGLLFYEGVKGCIRPSGIMHNKYMIIDNKYVITGSYNWSDNARRSNNENCVIIDDIDIVRKYQKNFDELMLKYCK